MSDDDATAAPMPSHPESDLDHATRARLWRRTILSAVVTIVLIVVLYALLPLSQLMQGRSDGPAIVRSIVALSIAAVVVVNQLRGVVTAEYPQMRVVQSFAIAVPTVLVVFSGLYESLSVRDPAAFSEPLDKVSALYFTLTTTTTVGFGDISALSDWARIVVMVQMVVTFTGVAIAGKITAAAVQGHLSQTAR